MISRHSTPDLEKAKDKQLQGISIESVVEKRRLDQALNTKEFAVLAGVSYSTARSWFRVPGFPSFRGVIFWQDFAAWRSQQNGIKTCLASQPRLNPEATAKYPPRAARILFEA